MMKRLATLLVAVALLFGACGGGGGGGESPATSPSTSLQGTYTIAGFWLYLGTENYTEQDYLPVSGTLTIGATSWHETITAGGVTSETTGTYTVSGDKVTLHTPDGDDLVAFRFIDTGQYGHVLELHFGPYSDPDFRTIEEFDFWTRR